MGQEKQEVRVIRGKFVNQGTQVTLEAKETRNASALKLQEGTIPANTMILAPYGHWRPLPPEL